MPKRTTYIGLVGEDEPLSAVRRESAPDKREISFRWLFGSTLTGITSVTLMGAALFVALDGKQFLATPPELANLDQADIDDADDPTTKTARIPLPRALEPEPQGNRRRMSVSTMTREGDVDVVRTKPFEYLRIPLAADYRVDENYPSFNPLAIFAEDGEALVDASAGSIIYGANVETEASIRTSEFIPADDYADDRFVLSDSEAEEIVRDTAVFLTDGTIEVASLHYVDPIRFGPDTPEGMTVLGLPTAARIVPENITVASMNSDGPSVEFHETRIDVETQAAMADLMGTTGLSGAQGMAEALSTLLKTSTLKPGHALRVGYQMSADDKTIMRTSVYNGREHMLTIALNDQDQYVPAREPTHPGPMAIDGDSEAEPEIAMLAERDLPTAYDAIYRGILGSELDKEIAGQIIRMVAAEVDFRSRIRFDDTIELFYSVPEEADEETRPNILYVEATFGDQTRKFYRFTDSEGDTDFYDPEGQSARQFLLRNPVPNGAFRSGFGMRRHPILKYSKMHWGVDWAAPRGTPIIAPGNGVVEKAGWAGGYGRQTIIRHANGYESSYSHQNQFAKGIKAGARVRQGQVIGYVGTTGLSTGPHLHYELRVNGERVDPMRVRLPKGNALSGLELEAFKKERDRIDTLIADDNVNPQVASTTQ